MALSTSANKVVHSGNGVATSFSYTFPILEASHLSVIHTDAGGNAITLGPSLYSATGIGTLTGGAVTYPLSGSPLASGETLTILRTVPLTQLTVLSNQGGYYPEVVERRLDYVYMALQQLNEEIGRATLDPPSVQRADVVETLAALKALTTRPAAVLVKNGQAAGVWQWVSGSATTADDGIVVECTTGDSGRYKRVFNGLIDALWYGVVASLATNSTAGMQAVAATLKSFRLSPGVYKFGDVTLSHNQTALCDGAYIEGATGSANVFKLTGTNPRVVGAYIGSHAACSDAAIVIGASTSARLENFCVLNGVNAIRLESTCSQPIIDNGWVNTFTGVGIDLVPGVVINPKFSNIFLDCGQVDDQPRVGAIGVRADQALSPSFTNVWTVGSEFGWILEDCQFPALEGGCVADTHGNWGVQILGACAYPRLVGMRIGTCGAGLRIAGITTPAKLIDLQIILTNVIPPGGSSPFFTASSPYDLSIEDTANAQIDMASAHVGTNWNVAGGATLEMSGLYNRWTGTYATNADLTTQIPTDDTIPQSTEGAEIISVCVGYLKSTRSKLRFHFYGYATAGTVPTTITAAIFKDSGADAIFASGNTQVAAAVYHTDMGFCFEYSPGAVAPATYKVRVGPNSPSTIRMNGSTSARRYGGVGITSLLIEEVAG